MNDLRARVEAEFDLSSAEPAWVETYEVACQTQDTIKQLEALVISDGLVTTGSKGQTRYTLLSLSCVTSEQPTQSCSAYSACPTGLGHTTGGRREGPAPTTGSRTGPDTTPTAVGPLAPLSAPGLRQACWVQP